MLGLSPDALDTTLRGVTHHYKPPGRDYLLHYVKFGDLKPRTQYYYKVKSGSAECAYSDVFSFRSGYASGETRLATYGDMGHSHFNNMQNMLDDCRGGKVEAIVHVRFFGRVELRRGHRDPPPPPRLLLLGPS